MSRISRGKGMKIRSIAALVGRFNGMSDADIDILTRDLCVPTSTLDVWTLSMAEASACIGRRLRYRPEFGREAAFKTEYTREAGRICMGEEQRSAATVEHANQLVDDAIAADPRLARRAKWHRGEEGEIACPALLAAGDDAPYFFRRRGNISEANGGESIRLVISTDSNEIVPGTAAAFIAAVKILQQWRSVEVWWQGAWMNQARSAGWVFHVPLVQGDMDFTRLDFCLSSHKRDTVSHAIMLTRTCEVTRRLWNGCNFPAKHCYLPGNNDTHTHFISHRGITPDPQVIAFYCAYWLGFSDYSPDDEVNRLVACATQALPEITKPAPVETAEQKARREREYAEAERKRLETEAEAAARRAAAIDD